MLDLLYQDAKLRVFNKPANISLLQDRHSETNLWAHICKLEGKPYLIHRLDKGTSGVLLVARNQATQTQITRQFAQRNVRKAYLAWVVGHFPAGRTYQINLPLCKGRKSRYRVAGQRDQIVLRGRQYQVSQDREGVDAFTSARTLIQTRQHSLLLLHPKTGRSHQLRVHLSWLGFPIVGDHLYGDNKDPKQKGERLMLHCLQIKLPGLKCFKAPCAWTIHYTSFCVWMTC